MDFEAKAREVLRELPGGYFESEVRTGLYPIQLVADALRAAALDEDVRREARADLQALLAGLGARAARAPARAAFEDECRLREGRGARTATTVVCDLLERLLWLLGLSEGERRFVTALAEDASDTPTALVYADWLIEQGLDLDAMRAAGWVRAEAVRSAAARVGADCEGHPHPRFREGAGNALARVLAALGDAP